MSEAGADQQVNGAIQEGWRANTYPKGCQDVAFTVHHRYPEMTRKKRLEQMFRNAVEGRCKEAPWTAKKGNLPVGCDRLRHCRSCGHDRLASVKTGAKKGVGTQHRNAGVW